MRKLLVLLVVILGLSGCGGAETSRAEGLTVDFLRVGKADAILLTTENSAVLIDAATEKQGDAVLEALRAQGVEALDVLIITHYDKDHVGGADVILENVPVARVLDADYRKDGKQYTQYESALERARVARESLKENISFELDGVYFEIDVANRDDYGEDEENDFSLVVRAKYGNTVFLFAGDAENARLAELLEEGDLAADVLKVPHHGRFEKLSPAFFEAVGARWGVITADEEEPEEPETLYALKEAGTEALCTREGSVRMVSDGETISVQQDGKLR